MVVNRVLTHLKVKLIPTYFHIHLRELRIIQHYPIIIKVQYFILICTEINGVAEVVFISISDLLLFFSFGRCSRKNFPPSAFLGGFGTAKLLLFEPFGIESLFLWVQVTV